MDDLEKRRAIRAIRRLARPTPMSGIDERLHKIARLATGDMSSSEVKPLIDGNALAARVRGLRDGGFREPDPTPKRKERAGRDRKERGGSDRNVITTDDVPVVAE